MGKNTPQKPELALRSLAAACAPGRPRWALQDAKAQFSEVVQRALAGEPQCVSRHGRDAVIVVSVDTVLQAVHPPENLFDFFQSSPLAEADLELARIAGGFRPVEL